MESFQHHFLSADGGGRLPSWEAALRVSVRSSAPPPSGFLLLREVEDLAVSLSQVLLLFEVHLERTLDGHEGDAPLGRRADGKRRFPAEGLGAAALILEWRCRLLPGWSSAGWS